MLLFRPERIVVNYWFTVISFSTSPCSFLLFRTTSGQRYRSTWDLVFRLSLSLSQWLSPPLPRLLLSSGSMRDLRHVCVRKPEDFVLSEFCCNFNLFFFFFKHVLWLCLPGEQRLHSLVLAPWLLQAWSSQDPQVKLLLENFFFYPWLMTKDSLTWTWNSDTDAWSCCTNSSFSWGKHFPQTALVLNKISSFMSVTDLFLAKLHVCVVRHL